MAIQQFSDLDFQNVVNIINLPDAANPQEPVTLAQLQGAIEGLSWKDNVRVAATANVSLASPGAAIDGVTLANGDRVLLLGQTATAENGIYIFTDGTSPLVRAEDASTSDELESAVVTVDEGSSAGTLYRQTQVNFVLDTDPVLFAPAFTGSPAASETTAGIAEIATQAETDAGLLDNVIITPLKLANSPYAHRGYAQDIGDGATSTIVVTHNLNSLDVQVQVRRNSGNFDYISVETQATSVNTVTLVFRPGLAPALNAFRVLVTRVV